MIRCVLLCVALAACSKKSGSEPAAGADAAVADPARELCEKVAVKTFDLGLGEIQDASVRAEKLASREQFIHGATETCVANSTGMDPALTACILRAQSFAALTACAAQKTASDRCNVVFERVAAVTIASDPDPGQQDKMAAGLPDLRPLFMRDCMRKPPSDAAMQCYRAARTPADLKTCEGK